MNEFTVRERPWVDPQTCFAEAKGRAFCVWLDSALVSSGSTRFSILASDPFKLLISKGNRIQIVEPHGTSKIEGNPFDVLDEQLALHHRESGEHPFPLGAAIGYFGYDLKNFVERLPARATDDLGLPDCWFGFYNDLLVFDHGEKKLWQVNGPKAPVLQCSNTPSLHHASSALSSNFTRETYRAAIVRAKEYIAAGDIYQVNLSQRFQCGVEAAPEDVYLALRESNPAPYCAYLDTGAAQILSSSPECFLNIHGRHVVTRPIKGTRPREKTGGTDKRVAAELLASPKDNAELVMITDLERNDLGRVCQFGSIRVKELVRVEPYATVFHLVSTVEGDLRRDVGHVECVRACFPGGSITGAPKIRAMQVIDELEPHARGVYTGAMGFFGFNDVTHFNVAIRTVVYQDGRLTFHAGGGIVADSEPDAEYDETLAKARGIFNAIEQLRIR